MVEFLSAERIDALVEGNRASVLWRATVRFADRPPVETMLYDLIELDEHGKLSSVLQFIDTAQVAAEMQALAL